jgi:hypothetical protein
VRRQTEFFLGPAAGAELMVSLQEDLIGVSSTEPIRGIDQHGVELAFSRQVAHALEAGTDQARATIAFVFESECRTPPFVR